MNGPAFIQMVVYLATGAVIVGVSFVVYDLITLPRTRVIHPVVMPTRAATPEMPDVIDAAYAVVRETPLLRAVDRTIQDAAPIRSKAQSVVRVTEHRSGVPWRPPQIIEGYRARRAYEPWVPPQASTKKAVA